MKFAILVEMLFELLNKRKLTAAYFSEKFHLSPRTVYRYLDELATAIPVQIKRGRNGGIQLSDHYKLPKNFMTKEEYDAALEAIERIYQADPSERFLNARRKLSAQIKKERFDFTHIFETGAFIADGGGWGFDNMYHEKIRLFESCIKNRVVLEIACQGQLRKVESHLLLLYKNVWYLYAFCHTERDFRLFPLAEIPFAVATQTTFHRRPFTREDIPLPLSVSEAQTVAVKLTLSDAVHKQVRPKLTGARFSLENGKRYAELSFLNDETLVGNILALGEGVEVVEPAFLRDKVKATAEAIAKQYL